MSMKRRAFMLTWLVWASSFLPARANPLLFFFGRRTITNLTIKLVSRGLRYFAGRNKVAQKAVQHATRAASTISNVMDAKDLVHMVSEWGGQNDRGEVVTGNATTRTPSQNIKHVHKCPTCALATKKVVGRMPPELRKVIIDNATPEFTDILVDMKIVSKSLSREPTPEAKFSIGW